MKHTTGKAIKQTTIHAHLLERRHRVSAAKQNVAAAQQKQVAVQARLDALLLARNEAHINVLVALADVLDQTHKALVAGQITPERAVELVEWARAKRSACTLMTI